MAAERNVFDWLDEIRGRFSMYVRDNSLYALEDILWGYQLGIGAHNIIEDVPQMNRHFLDWLRFQGWSFGACGLAYVITQRYRDNKQAVAAFFSLVDEYRRLRPTVLCTVKLRTKHNPTGKRWRVGLDGLMEKPKQVDIIRYRPEPLHFLRFHYKDRVKDCDLLMTKLGKYATTVRNAKQWVRDELQVEYGEWR
jgi:hypothetical protein